MSLEKKALYIVATPIGNLGDMTPRAVEILRQVDAIAAEDTRHSSRLLRHFGINTPCVALHEHNERQVCAALLRRIEKGESLALISDAGTPLLSDPGYHLVRDARAHGLKVIPVPGPSALAAALSVAGLPTDRFRFEGFLPSKAGARRKRLEALKDEPITLVFYEAPHRILETLEDMQTVFGGERQAVLARELTKAYETVLDGALDELLQRLEAEAHQRKGEMVILVHGATAIEAEELDAESERVLSILLKELPVKQAAALASEITGVKKNRLYKHALSMGTSA